MAFGSIYKRIAEGVITYLIRFLNKVIFHGRIWFYTFMIYNNKSVFFRFCLSSISEINELFSIGGLANLLSSSASMIDSISLLFGGATRLRKLQWLGILFTIENHGIHGLIHLFNSIKIRGCGISP